MIALGLALVLIVVGTAVFAALASSASSSPIALKAFNVTISASPLDLFIAGALSVVLLGLGLALISRGTRRSARRHKELRQLRKDNASATSAAAERAADGADSTASRAADRTDSGAGTGTRASTSSDAAGSPSKPAGTDPTGTAAPVADTHTEARPEKRPDTPPQTGA